MKIVKFLENSNALITGITKTVKNGTKRQRGKYLPMLIDN